jgi:hypothetical protein
MPFVKISYSHSNGFSISAHKGITTPIGRFSIEYTQNLYDKRKSSDIVYVDRITIQKQDLLVVFRNRNSEQDIVYKIKNGASLEATTNGKTNIKVREGMIIVDITDVENCDVVFNSKNQDNHSSILKNSHPGYYQVISEISYFYIVLPDGTFYNTKGYLTRNQLVYIQSIFYIERPDGTIDYYGITDITYNETYMAGYLKLNDIQKIEK